MTAGLFRGMTRRAAAQYSFLLSAPLIGGAVAKKLIEIFREGLPSDAMMLFAAGIIVSAFFGFLSISALMSYLQTRSTFVFIQYRIVLGVVVLALAYLWGFQ